MSVDIESLDIDTCPKCGGEVEFGYGLMGGGCGAYVFCVESGCDFFRKVQDPEEHINE